MSEFEGLTQDRIESNKQTILELLRKTSRPGMDRLLDWIENKSDFFIAPASTKYHLACEGGLAEHSMNVYRLLAGKVSSGLLDLPDDTVIITALLHDLCKVNFYARETKNVKEGTKMGPYGKPVANWVEKEVWAINDTLPIGHGEKSCYLIQSYIRLKEEEFAMIRFHMGSDRNGYPDPFAEAASKYPGVVAIHTSDIESAYIVEARQ